MPVAGNTISLTQSIDDRQVVEAWNKQLALQEKIVKQLANIGKESKKAGDDVKRTTDVGAQGFMSMAKATASYLGGITAVTGGLKLMISLEEEAQKKAAQTGKEFDSLQRSWRVLSGLRGLEAKSSQGAIEKIAIANSFTKEQAYGGAKGLVSAGFSPGEASGGALNELLYGMAAAGEIEGNPEELAPAIAGYLFSTGKKKDAAGIRDVISRIQALGTTNFTLKNLPALASEAGSLKELSSEEQFAGMAVLQEAVPGTTASTVMRNAVTALTAQKTNKQAMKSLKGLGVDADSIDLIGEDFMTAMSTIKSAYDKADPEMRKSYLATFAGKENTSSFVAVLDNLKTLQDNINYQKDLSGYEPAFKEATSGPNAMRRRVGTRIEQLRNGRNENVDIGEQMIELQGLEQGKSEVGISMAKAIYRGGMATIGTFNPKAGENPGKDIPELVKGLQENTAVMKENNNLMRQQNNGGKAPASPVMQQGRAP